MEDNPPASPDIAFESPEVLLIVPALDPFFDNLSVAVVKEFVSSLLRSLFSGRILLFRNDEMPLFRVERSQLEEIAIPLPKAGTTSATIANREFLWTLGERIDPSPRQWVVVANPAGLALRNIDHLFVPELPGPYQPPPADFLWTPAHRGPGSASPGLWAVKGESLPHVIDLWKELHHSYGSQGEEVVWTRLVSQLPIRKRQFESGEIVAPSSREMDWDALTHAAFITIPSWKDPSKSKLLHALYFGTYFADDRGTITNLLEA